MGLLDNFNFDDPRTMGLLQAGLGVMAQAGDTSRPYNVGQALSGGLNAYTGSIAAAKKQKQDELEYQQAQEVRQMQMNEMRRKSQMDEAIRGQYKKAYSGGGQELNPNWSFKDTFNQTPSAQPQYINKPEGIDQNALIKGLMEAGAYEEGMALKKQMRGENYKLGKDESLYGSDNKLIASGVSSPVKRDLKEGYIEQNESGGWDLNQSLYDAQMKLKKTGVARAIGSGAGDGVTRKPMTALQEVKYRNQIADDYKALTASMNTMDEVAHSSKTLMDNKDGLSGITGLQSYIPSYPNSKAAQADVQLQNLKGKITQLGKVAASAGGAIGAIANQEWKIMSDMIAAIDPSKGDIALKQQIGELNTYSGGATRRMADAYEKQYSSDFEAYPQFKTPTKQGGGAPSIQPPQNAINMLKMNPKLRDAFDAKYGAGASASVLGK